MNKVGADGVSLRTTLETYERQTGKTPDELQAIDCPEGYTYLWHWFSRLASTRPMGMSAGAIPESEIGWFFSNRGIRPTQRELDLIARLDSLMLQSINTGKPKGK